MRVIGGVWRHRKLLQPRVSTTRPMPDRIKEAVFSMLGSRYELPGLLPPLRVADVFAGGGSMGIEALSRGAASCSFFERNATAVDALRRNLETLGVGDRAEVCLRDAWRASAQQEDGQSFELIFLDPPYRESLDVSERGDVRRYLARLGPSSNRNSLVVLHHSAAVRFTLQDGEPWRIDDYRVYGTSALTFFLHDKR
jgi:16S rRNA (guanine966-N2)-methyltransferase